MTVPQQIQYQNQPPSQQQLQPSLQQQQQQQQQSQQQSQSQPLQQQSQSQPLQHPAQQIMQQPQQQLQMQRQISQSQQSQPPIAQPHHPMAHHTGQIAQVQHQQHLAPQGLNGGWQSESDLDARRKMIAKIVQLLQARKPNAPQEWLSKLPQMAKRLEETLYRSAPTFIAYNDASTLKQRLQQLAMRMKQPRNQQQVQQPQTQTQTQQRVQQTQHQGQQQSQQIYQQQQQQHHVQQQQQQALQQQQQQALQQQQQQQQALQQQQQQRQTQQASITSQPQHAGQNTQNQRMVNMSDINPIIASNPPQQQQQQIQTVPPSSSQTMPQVTPTYQPPANATNGARTVNGIASLAQISKAPVTNSNLQPIMHQPLSLQPAPATAAAAAPSASSRTTSDRAQVLRHQQQRLLLLRHAAKCPHEDGACPVTPHCAGMKRLWKHIAECKNQKCQVPHCVSSRYVLSHYHRCKDVRCPVCGPVREAIHRSHEKQKQMSQLKHGHQQALQQSHQATPASVVTQPLVQSQAAAPQPTQPPLKKPRTEIVPQPVQPAVPVSSPPPAQVANAAQPVAAPQHTVSALMTNRPTENIPSQIRNKPQEDLTLINSFTIEQIEKHIESLNRGIQLPAAKLKQRCGEVLKVLQTHEHGWVFNSPVDPVELGLPDYFEVIKRPMDLGTIKKRLDNGCYHSLEGFQVDVNLTFDNAMLYNPEGSVVYNMANKMKEIFTDDFENLIEKLKEEEDEKRKSGDACALCGSEKLLFEPPVFYCNGLKCSSQRIRRNSYYYVGGNNKYHWCHQCYTDLKENQEIQMPDATFKKQDLVKKKNDEVREESWVHCDHCNRWIHQICGLFNTRKNQDQRSEYVCPLCTIDERKKKGQLDGTSTTPMAEDLQRTKLSEHLERHVHDKVEEYIQNIAKDKAEKENISLDDARKEFEMGGPITIRQVTSMDRKMEVRDLMKKRYAFKNYPEEFKFRCKCIIVFQNLDGVDVILFGLYVYEHDETVPSPNSRTVYLSYLDSVHYMRPRKMRTYIYHEILVSYLDYVRKRGFSTVHIWACPPGKGDDYILYAKPEDQKTPRDDRLRNWYYKMLTKAQERGIVGKVTNMYDLYFADPKNDATVVPYMEGDYFPGEVENCIRDMEEGKHSKKASSDGKKKKKAKSKNKSGRKGTRSSGVDEEALAASGILPPGYDQKSMEQGEQDYVMKKLGQIIEPMKESFIVAYLAWDGARKEDLEVPKHIAEARIRRTKTSKVKSEALESDNSSDLKGSSGVGDIPVKSDVINNEDAEMRDGNISQNNNHEAKNSGDDELRNKSQERTRAIDRGDVSKIGNDSSATNSAGNNVKPDKQPSTDLNPVLSGKMDSSSKDVKQEDSKSNKINLTEEAKKKMLAVQREGKFAAMEARKRTIEGLTKVEDSKTSTEKEKKQKSSMITVKDRKGRLVKVLDDDEEEMDCEFLNNRQLFLELCQTNNYQFDQLRRAKHSSMMVLWHLHNRDAPKFVQQCAICAREILAGYRYHCPTCADFDYCQDCYQNPQVQRHQHPLQPIPVASNQKNGQTEEQRRERQRSIQLHMTLLMHAATCLSPKCHSQNCAKMKGLLQHGQTCKAKIAGGCNICKRIWTLLQIHARQCKDPACPVPKCLAIRERFRQIQAQQRAMDDRRRQHFNSITHSTG